MSASLRARAKAIFAEVVEAPASRRAGMVRDACGADGDLARIVEDLLSAHNDAGQFMGAPTVERHTLEHVGASADRQLSDRSGETLGRYRLLRRIGDGGFGEVYLAEQLRPVTRRVAVKLLKGGFDSARVVARFEAERQALALMDHPCIASVFDAGATDVGQPYFVMEHVQGEPVTEWCVRRQVSLDGRLQLFVKVCLAVQHAHQKGVIHRDLKPSNVLVTQVDGEATPRVIDFGVAKAIEGRLGGATIVTEEWSLIGTPAYMSPEQASMSPGAVDTRSDVYSLGVLLYELLADSPPFDLERLRSASFGEFQRIVGEEEPVRPSMRLERGGAFENGGDQARRAARRLRGDLDWIVMRALAKDRARRYQSAGALAADVRRFLSGEVVEAGPPSRVYRARKFIRRHRTVVAAAALVSAALIAGLATALTSLGEAREQRNIAVAALDESRSLTDFLLRTISSVEPQERGRDTTVAEMLDDAAAGLGAGFEGRPETRATMHHALGSAYMALGVYSPAEQQFRASLEIREATLGALHPETLRNRANLASALLELGRLDAALVESERVLAQYASSELAGGREAIGAMGNHAALLEQLGRRDDAIALRRRVLAMSEAQLEPDDEVRLAAKLNLAILLGAGGAHEESIAMLEETAIEWADAEGPNHPGVLAALDSLAVRFAALGRIEQAASVQFEMLERREAVLGPTHPGTLSTRINLGRSLLQLDRASEGVELLDDALRAAQETLGPAHAISLNAVFTLSSHFDDAGWPDADSSLSQMIIETLVVAAESPSLATGLRNAVAYTLVTLEPVSLRRPDVALPLAQAATDAARAAQRSDLVYFLDTLGLAQLESGDAPSALVTLDEALSLADALPDELRAVVREHRDAAARAAGDSP